MLVLKRKTSETIMLDGGIQIKVLRISGNMISLGIEAPRGVAIWRGELPQNEPLPSQVPASCGGSVPQLIRSA
jgi:carbon storage regulator